MVRIYGVSTQTVSQSGSLILVNEYKLYGQTSNKNTVVLTKDGTGNETASNIIVLKPNTSIVFDAKIIAKWNNELLASWQINGSANRKQDAETISIDIGNSDAICENGFDGLLLEFSESISTGGLSIRCHGLDGYTIINWFGIVSTTEV